MTTTFSDNLETCIINELMFAQQSIKIAVAWFNSKNILNILCWKLRGGVAVELILHFDEINSGSESSLDFTEYKRLGGILIWAKGEKSTMHVKFCIVDEKVLLHGSCNWTHRAFKKNDEVLNVTKDELEMINSYLSNFSSLKEKYTSPMPPIKKIEYATQKRKKTATKEERIRLFIEEMNRYDIQQYGNDYIKSFMEYWLEDATVSKMRFEDKADFVMMLELEDWGRKYEQIKEDEEYKCLRQSARKDSDDAYRQYLNYIADSAPWPDFTERLKQMNDAIEANAEAYKNTRMGDVFPEWDERRGKNTVYDYIVKHRLPMIITKSAPSGFVQYAVQFGIYSYRRDMPFIENGLPQGKYSRWGWRFQGLSTVKKLEKYFNSSLIEYCQVPARPLYPSFEEYSKRYIDSCVFASRYSYKLKNNSGSEILTKEKLKLLFEAAYAIENYNMRMKDYMRMYGHVLIGDIINVDDSLSVKDICVERYLSNCFLEIKIKMNNHFSGGLVVSYNTNVWGSKSLHCDVVIPRINKALNINIEFSDEIYECLWSGATYYTLSDDIYYARDNFRFLSLEEACGFNKEKVVFKPIMWYHKEILSWRS